MLLLMQIAPPLLRDAFGAMGRAAVMDPGTAAGSADPRVGGRQAGARAQRAQDGHGGQHRDPWPRSRRVPSGAGGWRWAAGCSTAWASSARHPLPMCRLLKHAFSNHGPYLARTLA